jgi:hypothetical protein
MSFLFFILFLVIFIGIAVLLSILGVVRNILGFGRRKSPFPGANSPNDSGSAYKANKPQSKVFADNEGEYVDYEEIKDK